MTISRADMSTHRGDVIYLESVRWPVNGFTRSRSMFNLILSSHFGSAEKLIMHTYWISMLWCDSCQNRLYADQYHLTVSRAQVIHGLFVYWVFGWVKVGNAISNGMVFIFHRAWCVRGLKSLKRYWLYLIPFRDWSRIVSLSNYCIWCLFLMKSGVVYAAI